MGTSLFTQVFPSSGQVILPAEDTVWLHALRVFACFSVVLVHISASVTYGYGKVAESYWLYSHVIESIFRSGLALFLLLSGTLLLPKTGKPFPFLSKRIIRVLPAFLFWSLVYAHVNDLLFTLSLSELGKRIALGIEQHLWFVRVILVLYVVLGLVGYKLANLSMLKLLYIWGAGQILVVFSFLLPEADEVIEGRYYLCGFLLMLLGYILSRWRLPREKRFSLGLLLTVVGIMGAFGLVLLHSKSSHQLQDFYYSIASPTIVIKSIGVYLLFSTFRVHGEKIISFILLVSKATFGIYLCHLIIRDSVLYPIGITFQFINPYIGIVVTAISCFTLSVVLTHLLSRGKMTKYLT